MVTVRGFGIVEYILVGIFVLAYLGYMLRIYSIFRVSKTHSKAIWAKLPIRTLYFGLLLFALLGPSFGHRSREIKSFGKDIFFLLDLSKSMDAFDIQPTRLEKVKILLKQMISKFNSDRIGLVIFAQDAYLQSPLTYDGAALMLFIQSLHTGLISNHGTNLAAALELALEKFEKDSEIRPGSEKSKVIVLISDGEDFGEEAEKLADKVAQSSIKFYALGIGTEQGSKIMEANSYKRDRQNKEVVTKLNRLALERLASKASGRYFEVSNSQNDVEKLINSISLLEGQMREAKTIEAQDDKFFYFLGLALVLMAADILLSIRVFKG